MKLVMTQHLISHFNTLVQPLLLRLMGSFGHVLVIRGSLRGEVLLRHHCGWRLLHDQRLLHWHAVRLLL